MNNGISTETGRSGGPSSYPPSAGRRFVWALLALIALVLFAGFLWLGTWQVERRAWKLDLIERVTSRVHAAPIAAPGPSVWPDINRDDHEYLHVRLQGSFLNDKETLVHGTTELGAGYWVLTPLLTDSGEIVMVNRGYVTSDQRDPASRGQADAETAVEVTGLLRLTEPKGGVLRDNVPAEERWYSRDVEAIAKARGLSGPLAPYFVDADATPDGVWPVGGLTVITFHNSHLVYAITWYGLALMTLVAVALVVRYERRRR